MSRPRLIERLNAGLNRKLTLIFAPAGSGTATLTHQSARATTLYGPCPAQTALHGDPLRIRNMGLPLSWQ